MATKEISAAWLVAAAILGVFGWLQLAGVHSGAVAPASDLSRRAPVSASAVPVIAAGAIAEDHLADRSGDGAARSREERICGIETGTRRC